jgi:hypothetical protein
MKVKHEDLFEQIDPPAGGIAKLRARLDGAERTTRRARVAFVAVPAALAVAAAVFLVLNRPRATDLVSAARAHGDVDQVALGLAEAPQMSAAVTRQGQATAGLVQVQTQNPNVAFYWVASTE